jgi:hypothetical protein
MDRRDAQLEDLPPLELHELRALDLAEPPAEGHPAHVAAASGVARRGAFVYVIGDDLTSLAVFRDGRPGELRRVLGPAPTGDKHDLEALTVLPPFEGSPYGALLGLASGSSEGRDKGFVQPLEADGSPRGEPVVLDLGPLYALLSGRIEDLNVEGACVMGDRLWLLHRGSPNVVAELSLDDVMASIRGDRRVDPDELLALREYELGELGGVPLTFSDATPLGERVLVFTASAEAEDGGIRGSVVGTIDLDGDVRRLRTIDRRYKVEGVHATIDTGVMDLVFVCDQDDPATPSPLLSATMPVDGSVER